MATTEQRFEHVSFSASAAAARRPSAAAGARFRLTLVLAGFAALVAWGILDQSNQRSGTDQPGASAATERQLYDGRGKWGGYMSEWRSRSQILQDADVVKER